MWNLAAAKPALDLTYALRQAMPKMPAALEIQHSSVRLPLLKHPFERNTLGSA